MHLGTMNQTTKLCSRCDKVLHVQTRFMEEGKCGETKSATKTGTKAQGSRTGPVLCGSAFVPVFVPDFVSSTKAIRFMESAVKTGS